MFLRTAYQHSSAIIARIGFACALCLTLLSSNSSAELTDKDIEVYVRKHVATDAVAAARLVLPPAVGGRERKLTRIVGQYVETNIEPNSRVAEAPQRAEIVLEEQQGAFATVYSKIDNPVRGTIHTRSITYLGLLDVYSLSAWAPTSSEASLPSTRAIEASDLSVESGSPANPLAGGSFAVKLSRVTGGAVIVGGGAKIRYEMKCDVGAAVRDEILGEVLPVECVTSTVSRAIRISTTSYLYSKSFGWYFQRSLGLWTISKPFFSPHRIRTETIFQSTVIE